MRLNKYIAQSGHCSRRKADELIKGGAVKINGKALRELGYQVREGDSVVVQGKDIAAEHKHLYVVLNKPAGYVCTNSQRFAAKTVFELLPKSMANFSIVGRLDKDSRGLLVLTNDGKFCYRVTHPKFKVQKDYIVNVKGYLEEVDMDRACKGIVDDGEKLIIDKYKIVRAKEKESRVKVSLHQGRKREIRRIFRQLGYEVLDLKRVRIGKLEIGKISEGQYKVFDNIKI